MKRNKFLINLVLITALITVTFSLAGCTGSAGVKSSDTAAASTAALETNPASKNEIIIESNVFKPDNVTIKVGDTITWINKDSYSHTVKASNGEFDSGNIASGGKFSFTFNSEGTYDYICGIHTFMKGTITVTK